MTTTTTCPRPDCDGDLEADGYCDTCGRAAPSPGALPATGAPPATGAQPATGALLSTGGTPSTGAAPGGPDAAPSTGPSTGPSTAGTGSGGTGSGGTASGRTRSGRSGGTSRRRIGGGLVAIAPEPERDPADAVLADPRVPEASRFCGACEAPVGRGRDDRPGRTEGFCPACGTRFSFVPTLRPGDLVAGQYEILGALAHGGLGWIHLARDRKVRDRWVVLKGVLNTGDAAALAAADAEQGFLALLVHPKIVRIYNVVDGEPETDRGPSPTYIVMEYVGGRSLRQMRDPREPMAVDAALAYVLEVLPALSHMHERGLLYCDFKPDNVVQTGTDVTLIDLGAVRRIDDPSGDVWGTVGYQAPEIAPGAAGPSVASDVFTVGRALAVLTLQFDFHRTLRDRLPDPAQAPALAEHEPFHRLLRRATDPRPERRFPSVDDLAEQMTGVLRQVVAAAGTTPPPRLSTCFGVPRGAAGTTIDAPARPGELAATLPLPLPDPDDPATPALTAAEAAGPRAVLAAAHELDTDQARLATVLAHLAAADPVAAGEALRACRVPGDWVWTWVALLHALTPGARADGDPAGAGSAVDAARAAAEEVADAVPGEPAPQVALAALAEHAGAPPAELVRRWERIWRTDRSWVSAAFGLARARRAVGDRSGAVAVLDEVPASSVHRADAQVAAVRLLLDAVDGAVDVDGAGDVDGVGLLRDAGSRLEGAELDADRRAELETEVLERARVLVAGSGGHPGGTGSAPGSTLLGCPLDDTGLALGIEERYRRRARVAPTARDRFALVDRANDARPWTRR